MVMQFEKPAVGSWTAAYPELGTGPISYEDSISPEFYELEREAIFRRTWLNIGRVEQVPRVSSYFTRELAVCDTSIVVVRGQDDTIRAFHNICRHRGNKLVWTDYPGEEVAGTCRQFTCKYHGWRYALDGQLTFVQQEDEFFDLDKSDYPLVEVHCDVWEGFIFVNLDREPAQTLREFLGEMGEMLEGYPFGELTQVFDYRAEVGSNWKLFIDAFQEFYHAPVLHLKQQLPEVGIPAMEAGFAAIHYSLHDDHRLVSTTGTRGEVVPTEYVKPIDTLFRSGLFGPWDRPEHQRGLFSTGMNPSGNPQWGLDSYQFFPNFVILVWEPGWYLTYHYWPLSVDRHLFEGRLYFRPPSNASERLAQELAAVTFKEFALQDGNTLEATQTMLQSRVVTEFPLCDQEVLCRHLHKVAHDYVDAYGGVGKDA
jgi:phenylpropionate dioxygenase-like ring-hydroxylating dioxygenase large terminal subunit